MASLTAHDIENLIDLVESKILCLAAGGADARSALETLESCRRELFALASERGDVRVIPFPESMVG